MVIVITLMFLSSCNKVEAQASSHFRNPVITNMAPVLKDLKEKGKKSKHFHNYEPYVILAFEPALAPLYKGVSSYPRLKNIPSLAIHVFTTKHQNIRNVFQDKAVIHVIKMRLNIKGEIYRNIHVLGNDKAYFSTCHTSEGNDYFAILQKKKLVLYPLTAWIED
jgi:hypothetical protein